MIPLIRISLLAGLFLAAASFGRADSPSAGGGDPEPEKGFLFSAWDLSGTEFAHRWETMLPELEERFPGMRFTPPDALHITVIYVGSFDWRELPFIESFALEELDLCEDHALRGGLLGRRNDVVGLDVLHMDGALAKWVAKSKQELNERTLREPERDRDLQYRPHITLARLKRGGDPETVKGFLEWTDRELDTGTLLTLSEPLAYRWLLAGSDYRMEGETYITTDRLRERIRTAN